MISSLFIILATAALVMDTITDVAKYNARLAVLEAICTYWFTFEYLVRMIVSPNKWIFFKGGFNIVDLLSIIPYYISRFLLGPTTVTYPAQSDPWRILIDVFRISRVLRILKSARHSNGLQSLGFTLRKSCHEFAVIALFIGIFIVIFASLVYFAEKDVPDTVFVSIPGAFWWAGQ